MAGQTAGSVRKRSARMAFCGVMTALGVTLMTLGGLIPLATYVSPLLAGIILIPVLVECGKKAAWLVYAATALVSVMLSADEEAAFFYIFLGYYPILKLRFDRIRPKIVRMAAKTGYFALAIGAMYAFLCFILRLDAILAEFREAAFVMNAVFFVMFVACMTLYDWLLLRLPVYYARVLRPKMRNRGR